jgi:chitinase
MAADIQKCQAKGKILTISLGGADAKVGFDSDGQAADFAHTIWNMFLGGNGPMRPFGDAVLDGVDLDIENGSSAHYNTFVNTIRSLAQNSRKRYYVTAAPQCPFPDAELGTALNTAFFDAVYVQFYNNFCETSVPNEFNMGTWDHWAKTQSANKNIRVYLGAPGSPAAAGNGYVSSQRLVDVARDAQSKYSSFGGVMLWDADSAQNNGRFHVAVKNGISNRSGGGPPDTHNPAPSPDPATTFTQQGPNRPTPTTPTDPAPTSVTPTPSVLPDPRKGGRVRPQKRQDLDASQALASRRQTSRLFRF